jgi:hypothetical protein
MSATSGETTPPRLIVVCKRSWIQGRSRRPWRRTTSRRGHPHCDLACVPSLPGPVVTGVPPTAARRRTKGLRSEIARIPLHRCSPWRGPSARGSEGDQERRAPKSFAAISSKDVAATARSGELSKAVTGAELSKVSEFVVQLCDQ